MRSIGSAAALVTQPGGMPSEASRSESDRAFYRLSRVKILCGCYRKDEAGDPDVYAAGVGAVLSDYPDDVVEYVTDPRTGLPSRCQWLPTIKEVRDACVEAHQARIDAAKRERDLKQQFADREKYEAERAAPRPTRAEIEAKLGRPIPAGRTPSGMPPAPPTGDGKHESRVLKDLAERAQRRKEETGSVV